MQLKSDFKPAWWLPNAHLQTVWATFTRRRMKLKIYRERLELPDGDFLDIDWAGENSGPVVLILHGLGGSINSPYASGLLHKVTAQGWRAAFLHFRGCSGEPNRLLRTYHCGETEDVRYVASVIKQRELHSQLAVVGFSLGGSVLLKWLGENPQETLLTAGIAISVPFELHKAANKMNTGFARFYQWWLLKHLKLFIKKKFHNLKAKPIDLNTLNRLNNFWQFDEKITAPLNGFNGVDDYYFQASARRYLRHIQTPTLILHALDDPFMTPDVVPEPSEISQQVILELSKAGGHVGFITGTLPWKPVYWLEDRIIKFLDVHFKRNCSG